MPGAFKLDNVQPFRPILFWNFSNSFTFILGSPFLLPQREWLRQRGFRFQCLHGAFKLDNVQHFRPRIIPRGVSARARVPSKIIEVMKVATNQTWDSFTKKEIIKMWPTARNA